MRQRALDALAQGADFVELRFDFVEPSELESAIAKVSGIKPNAVFTLRSKSQGGRFSGSEQERITWLKRMAQERPMFVDIELDSLRENDSLADYIDIQKTRVLVSWHDFQSTPPADDISDILSEMRVYSNFVKVVTTAKTIADSLRLLELYNGTSDLHAIIFAMGDAGVLSRVLCPIVGNAPFTYASLDSAVAPGQLTLVEMRKLYDRIGKS
jgi:3-dehydroquinate dehydratase-1